MGSPHKCPTSRMLGSQQLRDQESNGVRWLKSDLAASTRTAHLHPLQGLKLTRGSVDEAHMLHVLCDPLQETQGLVEGDRHGYLGQLLERRGPGRRHRDTPNAQGDAWSTHHWGCPKCQSLTPPAWRITSHSYRLLCGRVTTHGFQFPSDPTRSLLSSPEVFPHVGPESSPLSRSRSHSQQTSHTLTAEDPNGHLCHSSPIPLPGEWCQPQLPI
jgi:hypothetical protein